MNITLYTAPMSSAIPVEHALLELRVPHERVVFDLGAGAHRNEDFLAKNPNGKVPTLVVDGTPLFEAAAILQWLGDTFGAQQGLWPAFDSAQRLEALSWTTWAYTAFSPPLKRFNIAGSPRFPESLHHRGQRDRCREELQDLLGVLDGRLARQPVLVGETYSIADLAVSNALAWAELCEITAEGFEHLQAWLAACKDRPAFREAWNPARGG